MRGWDWIWNGRIGLDGIGHPSKTNQLNQPQHKHAQLWTHPLVCRLLRLDALERARAAQEAHFEDWLWAACRPTSSLAKDLYSPSPKGCAWPNETQAHVRWLFEDRLARVSAREHFWRRYLRSGRRRRRRAGGGSKCLTMGEAEKGEGEEVVYVCGG